MAPNDATDTPVIWRVKGRAIRPTSRCVGGDATESGGETDALARLNRTSYFMNVQRTYRVQLRRAVAGLAKSLPPSVVELLAGNTFNDPPPGVMLVMADAMFSCVSVTQMMVDLMVADGATQEEAECFANGFDEEFMKMMVTSDLTGEEPSPEEEEAVMAGFFEVMMTCGG